MMAVDSNAAGHPAPLVAPRINIALPEGNTLRSRAFSRTFQTLTSLIVGSCTSWFILTWLRPAASASTPFVFTSGTLLILASLAMMALTAWHIMTSVTTLSHHQICQTWIWNKEMAIEDLAYVKLIRVRGLEWLIAPRLYVRTVMGRFAVFYAAEPQMIALFQKMQTSMTLNRSKV